MRTTQEEALNYLRSGKNAYLTWPAGSWKTYTISKYVEEVRKAGGTVIIVAPTGISAINAGGATIHSTFKVFGYYPNPNVPYKNQSVDWEKVGLLIYDEISMVGPDMLDHTDAILRKERKKNLPFWGIQTVFVGDLKQLPPVYAPKTPEEKDIVDGLRAKYGTLSFENAKSFEGFELLELEEIKRQNDPKLIGLLNRIRNGDLSAVTEFQMGNGDDKTVHLMPFNDMVNSHNLRKLYSLPGTSVTYNGILIGRYSKEECMVPEQLQLKVGARVIICKNLPELGLVNGDTGDVVALKNDQISFRSDRTKEVYQIQMATWTKIVYEGGAETVVGSYIQMPMKLAYAITVHKSQGLSIDHLCVHVSRGMQPNLLYVALSRSTNFENLFVNFN